MAASDGGGEGGWGGCLEEEEQRQKKHSAADEGEQTGGKFALTAGGSRRRDAELKEHPFWSRCVDDIQGVCAASWTGSPPLRASLLIRAVEPQQLEDTVN